MSIRETLEQGEYVSARPIGFGDYVLTDTDGKKELWFANPGHAGYGVILDDGTELEFVRSIQNNLSY